MLFKLFKVLLKKIPGVRYWQSRLYPEQAQSVLWGYGSRPTYSTEFVEFVAQKRGINAFQAQAMVKKAEGQFKGGWGGNEYRRFTELALETFRPLFDDNADAEVIETYKFHAGFDFLRMLGYSVPTSEDIEPIVSRLSEKPFVAIVDYGFGLAHRTIAVSRCLLERGIKVKLYLVDIRRELLFQFVDFVCRKYHIDHEFIEVTLETPYPELPLHHYCDIVSVFEHIREPLTVMNNIDRALCPGGLLLALVGDAIEEMMHLSPDLKAVRDRLAALGYQQVFTCYGTPLWQKGPLVK